MATKVTINGRQYARPDVYSIIKSGITNPPLNLSYGNAVLIDTGIGASYGGGSGFAGELKNGLDSVYEFNNIDDFRNFVKGGELWNLAEPLFRPDTGVNGVSKLFLIKAATTTAALKSLVFSNGSFTVKAKDEGSVSNGVTTSGELTKGLAMKLIASPRVAGKYVLQFWMGSFKGLDSLNSNAPYNNITQANSKPVLLFESPDVSSISELITFFNTNARFNESFTLTASNIPPASTLATPNVTYSNVLTGFGGTFATGITRYFKVTALNAIGETVASSEITLTTTQNDSSMYLYWEPVVGATKYRIYKGSTSNAQNGYYEIPAIQSGGNNNYIFIQSDSGATAGTPPLTGTANYDGIGTIVPGDLTSISGYQLFAGGTETYLTDLSNIITAIKNLDFTHFLFTEYGANSMSANNTALFEYLTSGTLKYERFGWVGAGYDEVGFDAAGGTIETAEYYDNAKIITVHGGSKKTDRTKVSGFRNVSQLWKTAAIMGRTLGLEPQTPVTFKSININAEIHNLSDDQKEIAISKGVLYTNFDYELNKFVVGAGINSKQDNEYLIDANGNSYSIQIERIKSQLNKELIFNAKQRFFGNETGANRNTVSEEEIIAWLKGFLTNKIATNNADNLIVTFDPADISVVRNQDTYNVTYSFVPNGEITKIVFTGFMLD